MDGVKIIDNFSSSDDRGSFTKIYNASNIENSIKPLPDWQEVYYSCSGLNVIRGIHFQLPPHDHCKLVHVMQGRVVDVIVDLRKNSPSYKKYIALELGENSESKKSVYIPKGMGHGFLSLSEHTTMIYLVSSLYNPCADTGIRWDTIGYDWMGVRAPVISSRDRSFISLDEFNSPF